MQVALINVGDKDLIASNRLIISLQPAFAQHRYTGLVALFRPVECDLTYYAVRPFGHIKASKHHLDGCIYSAATVGSITPGLQKYEALWLLHGFPGNLLPFQVITILQRAHAEAERQAGSFLELQLLPAEKAEVFCIVIARDGGGGTGKVLHR